MATNSSNYSYIPYQLMDTGNTQIRATLLRYVRHWYWFVLSVGTLLITAFLYLLYQQPVYKSRASLLVKDEKKGLDSESMLKELEIFAPKKVVENEIEVLKSYTLMARVVQQLHLDVVYYQDTPFGKREIFNKSPVHLIIEQANPSLYSAESLLNLSFIDKNTVQINGQLYPLNQSVRTPYGRLRVFPRQPVSSSTAPIFVQVFEEQKQPTTI